MSQKAFETFVSRVWNILANDDMNNKDFVKFYRVEYEKIKDILLPNPYDKLNLSAEYNFPVTMKSITDECVMNNQKVVSVLDSLSMSTFGKSLAVSMEILRTCPVADCLCKITKYWLMNLVNISFLDNVTYIKKVIYACWEIIKNIGDGASLKPLLIKVFFRTINMILKEHRQVAPYCAKIGILVFQNTTFKFAIYTFSWNNYKTKVSLSKLNRCNYCMTYDTMATFKACAGCKKAYYCDTECQKEDWKSTHKKLCS